MKKLIILVAVIILAAAEVYSGDFSRNENTPIYYSYLFSLNNVDELSDAENYFVNSVSIPPIIEDNGLVNADVNEKALQSENIPESNEEESDEVLFDGSAGAMGIGIF